MREELVSFPLPSPKGRSPPVKQLLAVAGLGCAPTCLQPQQALPAWHSLFGLREWLRLPLLPLLPAGELSCSGLCRCWIGEGGEHPGYN